MKIFDYIFFRVFYFFKAKNDFSPETKGSLIVSLIQCFTFLLLFDIGILIFDYSMFTSKWQALPLILLVGIFNWYRYEKNFDLEELEAKWPDEDHNKRIIRGFLIIIYLIVSAAIPVLRGMAANGQL